MKILLVTHSYGLNGAAILLRDVAKHWVQNKNHQVDALISEQELIANGALLKKFGVIPKLTINGEHDKYDLAIVNTILDIEFVEKLAPLMPVLVWVHEGNTILSNWNLEISKVVKNFTQSHGIIFQTQWQSENVFRSFLTHVESSKIHYLPSGVDVENVTSKQNYEIKDAIKIISLGTVYPRKRQMDLVRAIDNLSQKYNIECHIIGDYSQSGDWKQRIEKDLSIINSNIKWLGAIEDREKINELLIAADIACFPSGDESHPLALLESGLCSLPMLISNLAPYKYIGWTNNKNCLMHEIGDVSQITIQLDRLIKDSSLRARLGKNAREMVINKYDKNKFFNGIDRIVNRFISHHE